MDPSYVKTALVKFRREDTSWVVYDSTNSPLPGSAQFGSLGVTSTGVIWAYYYDDWYDIGGVVRHDGNDWTFYTRANSPLPDNSVWALAIDKNDNPWIGCVSEGVAIIYDNPTGVADRPQSLRACQVLAFPSPFRRNTTIRYSLSKPSPVTVSVVDATGRTVSQLISAPQSTGNHEMVWDGHMVSGKSAPAGVYFVRVRTGGTISTARLVLSR
jgi:hypothetical protein